MDDPFAYQKYLIRNFDKEIRKLDAFQKTYVKSLSEQMLDTASRECARQIGIKLKSSP
jgi:hypothetical protein